MTQANHFDYIIAGGGSAGCALAARLSENSDNKVCLIEAGGNGRDLFIRMPAGNGFVFGNPKLDWGYQTIPQSALDDRTIYLPRGKSLGGSTIMNGMIYMRGVPEDYDQWRDSGLKGWGFADLLPYFKRSESAQQRKDEWHGQTGPLPTDLSLNYGVLEQAFVDAAIAAGHKSLDDFNGPVRTGVARTDSTVLNGIRQSSAIAYLQNPADNLTLKLNSQIHRVLFEGNRAIGVEMVNGEKVFADGEVVLCQGAFGTPQTLMLSGIGDADHLQRQGITPIIDQPEVGKNLADHLDVSMQYASDRMDLSLARYQRLDKAAGLMTRWLINGSGPGGGAFFSVVLFHALKNPALPEFEVFMTPMVIDENLTQGEKEAAPLLQRLGRKLLVRGSKVARPGVQIDINLERPRSMGTVTLASNNPLDDPVIDPRYLSNPEDLEELVQGVHAMRDVMSQNEIAQYLTGETGVWQNAKTHQQIEHAIKASAYSGHHPCSTARMGADDAAVLDADLRVKGIEGLRICDASAMPTQITGNLNATIIAMAEKAADMILDREPLTPEDPRIAI